jgi:hypothetical protein
MNYTLSFHASNELVDRQIPLELLEEVLSNPQQIIPDQFETKIYQSVLEFPNGKEYLLRIVLAEREPVNVITIYRTSKIKKYWR